LGQHHPLKCKTAFFDSSNITPSSAKRGQPGATAVSDTTPSSAKRARTSPPQVQNAPEHHPLKCKTRSFRADITPSSAKRITHTLVFAGYFSVVHRETVNRKRLLRRATDRWSPFTGIKVRLRRPSEWGLRPQTPAGGLAPRSPPSLHFPSQQKHLHAPPPATGPRHTSRADRPCEHQRRSARYCPHIYLVVFEKPLARTVIVRLLRPPPVGVSSSSPFKPRTRLQRRLHLRLRISHATPCSACLSEFRRPSRPNRLLNPQLVARHARLTILTPKAITTPSSHINAVFPHRTAPTTSTHRQRSFPPSAMNDTLILMRSTSDPCHCTNRLFAPGYKKPKYHRGR
jgi:hypothetical protein